MTVHFVHWFSTSLYSNKTPTCTHTTSNCHFIFKSSRECSPKLSHNLYPESSLTGSACESMNEPELGTEEETVDLLGEPVHSGAFVRTGCGRLP